ncbi:MAG: M42 family metallopeptidase [Armatimonadota bacterium]
MRLDLLKELCETPGLGGREERIRSVFAREMSALTSEVRTDPMGNVIAHLPGKGKPRVMVAAHIDEIGFYVNTIDDKGFLRLVNVGGVDIRAVVSQRVLVQGKTRDLVGIIMPSAKPIHLADEDERRKVPKVTDLFVDLGLSKDEVTAEVEIGTPVTLMRELCEVGSLVSCKAMDDRVGAYVAIEAVRKAVSHEADVFVVGTAQEECHGLVEPAAYDLQPDMAIAVDVTAAGDIPGGSEQDRVTQLGAGAAIKVLDSGAISHPKLVMFLRKLAEDRGIKHQLEILPRGGTDAGPIQRVRSGVPVAGISIPLRYVHTSVEAAHKEDIQACIDLLAAFIEEAHKADLAL